MSASLVAMLATGCLVDVEDGGGDADEPEVGEVSASLVSENGKSLNGVNLNGKSLNGKSLNGVSLDAVTFAGAKIPSTADITNLALTATNFSGKANSVAVSNWVGTTWKGTLSDGTAIILRIDSKSALPAPNADVSAYGVSYQTSGGWSPLCGVATTLAIPIAGSFNNGSGVAGGGSFTASSTKFTFGCRGTAIAKCVELGYKPWKTVGGTLLQKHHVACTRMLRADFCGDGKSWTIDGTQINLYDAKGVQADTEGWTIEAEWDHNGARRVNKSSSTRWKLNAGVPPGCYTGKVDQTKTGKSANFSSGTLLMSEYQ